LTQRSFSITLSQENSIHIFNAYKGDIAMQKRYLNNHRIALLISCIAVLFVPGSVAIFNSCKTQNTHVNASVTDYYGFTSASQKEALESLFKQASVIPAGSSLSTLFPPRQSTEERVNDLLTIVEKTQEKLVIRTGTQERWEVAPDQWMKENVEQNYAHLKTLGFVDRIVPAVKESDAACILGATRPVIAKVMSYSDTLIDENLLHPNNVVLLTGERYVSLNVDGSEEQLTSLAQKINTDHWSKLTETHLMVDEYNTSPLHDKKIATHVIDTPRGDLSRPNTQTTTLELIKWLRTRPDIKHITFVSSQPYVQYQKAQIDLIFKEQDVEVTYEVIGPQAKQSETIKPVVEGLGAYLWAQTPAIISDLLANTSTVSAEIKERCARFYAKTPALYQTLPKQIRE
jgi:hypothetical protein